MKIQLPADYEFLHFDRFDVHVKGNALTETQIEQTKAVIASTTDLSLKGLLSRQLGIYYGFHLRSAKQASEYCRIWQSTIDDQSSEAYAQACNYLGFAESIDGGYRDPALFKTALAIYQELEKTATEANELQDIKLNQAFAMRYIGVTTRRQGIQLDKAGDVAGAAAIFERAFKILSNVVAIQQTNHANPIDLAESFHLLGVFYQSRKLIQEAEASLQHALAAWEDVVRTTGPHPIKFVTMQSLGNIQMHQRKTRDAIELLQQTRVEQENYFGTEMQEDIAKTMHFLGEALEANGEPLKALAAYVESLKIKQTIKLSEAITQPTRLAIERHQETLAASINEMNIELAATAYHELHTSWQSKPDCQTNLSAGRFYVSYAKFLRDYKHNLQDALKQFEAAQSILTAAGAHEFAREIAQDIQSLQEVCARITVREHANSPHFHRPESPSHQQPMGDTSILTATNASMN